MARINIEIPDKVHKAVKHQAIDEGVKVKRMYVILIERSLSRS